MSLFVSTWLLTSDLICGGAALQVQGVGSQCRGKQLRRQMLLQVLAGALPPLSTRVYVNRLRLYVLLAACRVAVALQIPSSANPRLAFAKRMTGVCGRDV